MRIHSGLEVLPDRKTQRFLGLVSSSSNEETVFQFDWISSIDFKDCFFSDELNNFLMKVSIENC